MLITHLMKGHHVFYILWVVIAMFSICCHEFAHAWIALRQGDPTARDLGHLTFNPLKQMGALSIGMLLLIGFAWGAVPVRVRNLRSKWSQLFVIGAGPATNLLLFFLFGVFYAICWHLSRGGAGPRSLQVCLQMLLLGSRCNMLLFILNMLPIPILDGWTIWSYAFPKLERLSQQTRTLILYVALAALMFGFISYIMDLSRLSSELLLSAMNAKPVNVFN